MMTTTDLVVGELTASLGSGVAELATAVLNAGPGRWEQTAWERYWLRDRLVALAHCIPNRHPLNGLRPDQEVHADNLLGMLVGLDRQLAPQPRHRERLLALLQR